MTKIQFLLALDQKLSVLPRNEAEERLNFYCEMIEDRMEEGLSEEEAVCAIGPVDAIAAQIIAQFQPIPPPPKPTSTKKRFHVWEILLLVLGSPVWLSLLMAALAVGGSLYISLWAVIVALWAVSVAVAGSGTGCIASGIGFIINGNGTAGIAMLGAGLVCIGLSVFLFWGCKAITKGFVFLTKKLARWIKGRFQKKEGV